MGLAGTVIRRFQGHEMPAEAMAFQAGRERPAALAGGDAQQDLRMVKGFEGVLSTGHKRLVEVRALVQAEGGLAIVGGEARRQRVPLLQALRQQAGDRHLQPQADDPPDLCDLRRRQGPPRRRPPP